MIDFFLFYVENSIQFILLKKNKKKNNLDIIKSIYE